MTRISTPTVRHILEPKSQNRQENKMKYTLNENGTNLYFSKLSALSDEYFHLLTPWQRKFITSVYEFLRANFQKQMDQVDNIFGKLLSN